MIKKLLAIVLLLHIGLLFAQNSVKPPPSPFSFQNEGASVRNVPPIITDTNQIPLNMEQQPNEKDLKPIEQSKLDDLGKSVIDVFEEKMKDYGTKLIPHTLKLFYTLLILSILLSVTVQMILGNNFKEIITSLVFIIFTAQFFVLLIENWVEWSNWIVNYFVKIGTSISDVNLQPSEILKYATKYISRVYENLSFTNLGQSLMYIFLAVPTFFLIIQMIAVYVFALFEFIVISKLSVIYLAFAGIKFTQGYAKKPLMFCLACGLKLMFLQLFFGGALGIIADFSTKQMSIQLAMVMFICSVILNMLVQKLPQIVDTFIHGTTSATMGGNISTMTKALGGVAMGTAKAVMKAMDAKKLAENASKLAGSQPAAQAYDPKINEAMERSYQAHKKHVMQQQQAKDNLNKDTGSSPNSSTSSFGLNKNSSQENQGLNKQTSQSNKTSATDNKAGLNNTNSTPLNNSSKDAQNNKSTTGNTTDSSNNISSVAGKIAQSSIHGLKTAGHMASALIKNDFDLNKANQHLDTKLYKNNAANAEQERIWDRIYSGQSPENYAQAEKYLEHGNKMEKDNKYAEQYLGYVDYRRQLYQDSENQLSNFAQDTNSLINQDTKTDNTKDKDNT